MADMWLKLILIDDYGPGLGGVMLSGSRIVYTAGHGIDDIVLIRMAARLIATVFAVKIGPPIFVKYPILLNRPGTARLRYMLRHTQRIVRGFRSEP